MQWTTADIPDLSGQIALVTGANSGIGYETAKALALAGATVVLACRNQKKAEDAAVWIRDFRKDARLEVMHLDLGDLTTVRECAAQFLAAHSRLDILVNNAGLVAIPRQLTVAGFEMQLGVNHLGHFALTAALLPRLRAAPAARVVCVSSLAYAWGRLDFEDLPFAQGYRPWKAYSRSKLANLLFAEELDRRLQAAGLPARAYAAHPGYAATGMREGGKAGNSSWLENFLLGIGNKTLAISAEQGALPSLYAATAPGAIGGRLYGPDRFFHLRGYPGLCQVKRGRIRPDDAQRLWEVSEALTGAGFLG
jgi:NAD(P)-dependent dehydrogenase (short-subunit alcohol dehydrogenase family)